MHTGTYLTWRKIPKPIRLGRFYSLPKIHKPDVSVRPIVGCVCCGTYKLIKYLIRFLKPYQKIVVSHINDVREFARMLKGYELENDEYAVNFDVVSLETSVPIENSLNYLH